MLTQAPLPSWRNLILAFLRRPVSDDLLLELWAGEGETAGLLSRSAWSLALIALWRRKRAKDNKVTVWLPDYFCNAPLEPLRATGSRLVFYPLNEDLEPDIPACREMAESQTVDIFVHVHYFGRPVTATKARDFCKQQGAWLIEDAAHVLIPVNGIGVHGDFVLYSVHKHLAIPDGAVVVIRSDGAAGLMDDEVAFFGPPESWPAYLSNIEKKAMTSGRIHRSAANIWMLKRLLQKMGFSRPNPAKRTFAERSNLVQDIEVKLSGAAMSRMAKKLMARSTTDLRLVCRKRQRHQMLWDAVLNGDAASVHEKISAAERPEGREWTPYMASYRLSPARDDGIYKDLNNRGLPVTTWPDLPPEVIQGREKHDRAWNLRHGRFYLPVHQSLSVRSIMKIHGSRENSRKNDTGLRLAWDRVTRKKWAQWLELAGRSNLLQSWAYGEARAEQSGWRVERGVFYDGSEPVALVQILVKRLAGIFSIARINRGPIFLRDVTTLEWRSAIDELASFGNIWRGRIIKLAPELGLSGANMVIMHDAGYRQSSYAGWESVWLDLGQEPEELRRRLNGKWRNMLTFSEKKMLELEVSHSDGAFNWMMDRYKELMREKDFEGPPVNLLQSLRRHLEDEEQVLILRAIHESDPVAGICLARHGVSATYLLGWNGKVGRALKANQYLLWQAALHLKEHGIRWFDLGGINEAAAPGIAAFKLGMNGERYELVGDYWKW